MFKTLKMPKALKIIKLYLKKLFNQPNIFPTCIILGALILLPCFANFKIQEAEALLAEESLIAAMKRWQELGNKLIAFQDNTLSYIANPNDPPAKVAWKLNTIATGYSSTPDQTDSTPFITAANTQVRDGVVAANFLPLGTEIRIPELYGDKIFVVEDRMHPRKHYLVDIWFSTREQALEFGAKKTIIEVLEG